MKTMAEVLDEHIQSGRNQRCTCGWRPDSSKGLTDPGNVYAQHRHHLADALTAAGYGPVKAAGAQALRDAAELIEANRPEMGPGVNITQYREGRDDAFVRAAVVCTRYADKLDTP